MTAGYSMLRFYPVEVMHSFKFIRTEVHKKIRIVWKAAHGGARCAMCQFTTIDNKFNSTWL